MTVVKPPTRLRVGAHVYSVHWDEVSWSRLREREDGLGALMGRAAHHTSEIFIKPDLSPSQKRDTLLHEVMHCIISVGVGVHMANIKDVSDLEEYVVSSTTPWLLAVLRDNPPILAYLLAT